MTYQEDRIMEQNCERCGKVTRIVIAVFVGMGSWWKICFKCWHEIGEPRIHPNANPIRHTVGALSGIVRGGRDV